MNSKWRALAMIGTCLGGCAESKTAETIEPVEPPPQHEIFLVSEGVVDTDTSGQPITETLYLFNTAIFDRLCVVPDADSFDDYTEVDRDTGTVIVPRGSTTFSEECEADGIVTGPMHEELYPSSWCRAKDCGAATELGGEPTEGGY